MATLAAPVVSFLLQNISRLLIEEAQFLGGVSEQARQLESDLRLMLSHLRDADSRQHEGAVIQEWILQSKDLAYEAEDVLETFAFKIASRRGRGLSNILKRYTCILNDCFMRRRVGSKIQNLQARISDLTDRFQKFGIRTMMEREGSSSTQQQLIRRTYSHVEEDDFVGLENDVELLVKHLTDEAEVGSYRVVSICGMGKTTIARKVYHHPNVRRHFDAFAWVCVSQQWQPKVILQQMLLNISPTADRKEILELTLDELVGRLYRNQQSKKCLIVVDDIWSTDAWENIKDAFPSESRSRSKILLTSRNRNVAIHIGPNGFHHEPRLLSHDESWELLQKKALRDIYTHPHGMSSFSLTLFLSLAFVF